MAFTRRTLLAPLAITIALALTPMITACGGNPVQDIIKGATGGQVDVGGTSVPADFPADVPIPDGKIILSTSLGSVEESKVWNLSIQAADAGALEKIATKLADAGFTVVSGDIKSEDGAANILTKDDYSVLVVLAKDDKGGFIMNYTVTYTKPGS